MAKKKKDTGFKHIDFIDVNNDGILEEVAVVKKWGDGSLSYIDVVSLDPIEKGRLKKIIEGLHSDKYELWELLSQAKLSNGMNALDFFHANLIKVLRGEGAKNSRGSGLGSAKIVSDKMPGSDFTDPAGAMSTDGNAVNLIK